MTAVISEISDFDHFLNILKSHRQANFESQIGILESYLVVLNDFWNLKLSQKFVKMWNFSWPRSLAKFQILTIFSTFSNLTSK